MAERPVSTHLSTIMWSSAGTPSPFLVLLRGGLEILPALGCDCPSRVRAEGSSVVYLVMWIADTLQSSCKQLKFSKPST